MDAGLAGLIGVGIGSALTGGLALLNTREANRFQTGQAEAQRVHDADEAVKQREHELAAAAAMRAHETAENAAQREHEAAERRQRHAAELLPQRLALVAEWRAKLQDANDYYENHRDQSVHPDSASILHLLGRPWFESFRAHLTDSDAAEEFRKPSYILVADWGTTYSINEEIARIENRWIAEALG